jgi:hypothetical protein
MTVTELKKLLETVEELGHGDASVAYLSHFVVLNLPTWSLVTQATLIDRGGDLLSDHYRPDFNVRLS